MSQRLLAVQNPMSADDELAGSRVIMRVLLIAIPFIASSTDHQNTLDNFQYLLSPPVISKSQTQVKMLGGLTPGAYETDGDAGNALHELRLMRNEQQSASPSFAFFSQP